MRTDYKEQITLAKDLLSKARHIAVSTVNEDGSPHNTPLAFIYSPDFTKIYWGSHPASLHSKNIKREDRIFMVLFDAFQHGKGGLYIKAENAHELSGQELEEALKTHNRFRANWGKKPLDLQYYTNGEQRMYGANVVSLEVYSAERDDNGLIKKEARTKITAQDLIGKH